MSRLNDPLRQRMPDHTTTVEEKDKYSANKVGEVNEVRGGRVSRNVASAT